MAMPEVTIGLYPDVGGTWFLNRTPGQTGMFLGLTGAHINGTDVEYIGLEDYFITQNMKEEVMTALTKVKCESDIDKVLNNFSKLVASKKPTGNLIPHIDWVNSSCDAPDVATVIEQITVYDGDDTWCSKAAQS